MKVIDVRIVVDDESVDRAIATDLHGIYGLGDWIAETIGDGILASEQYLAGIVVHQLSVPEPRSLRIVRETHRGQQGHRIQGSGFSIFTKTRPSAERIKERIVRGEDIRPEDWNL